MGKSSESVKFRSHSSVNGSLEIACSNQKHLSETIISQLLSIYYTVLLDSVDDSLNHSVMFWIPSTHYYTIHLSMTSTWSGADGGCFIPPNRHTLVVITNVQHDCIRDTVTQSCGDKAPEI